MEEMILGYIDGTVGYDACEQETSLESLGDTEIPPLTSTAKA